LFFQKLREDYVQASLSTIKDGIVPTIFLKLQNMFSLEDLFEDELIF